MIWDPSDHMQVDEVENGRRMVGEWTENGILNVVSFYRI